MLRQVGKENDGKRCISYCFWKVLFRERKEGGEERRVLRGQRELIFSVVQEMVKVVDVLVSFGGCYWCGLG